MVGSKVLVLFAFVVGELCASFSVDVAVSTWIEGTVTSSFKTATRRGAFESVGIFPAGKSLQKKYLEMLQSV